MFLKSIFLCFCAFICLSNLEICNGQDEVPLVQVKQGQIQGRVDTSLNGKKFYSYMSIPFAEPPVGELRFKDPVPKKSWEGILNGTKMPAPCLQCSFYPTDFEEGKDVTLKGREDCLHLNVFTPVLNQSEKELPVMVYIHGGGFTGGSSKECQPYVLLNKDIVLVGIQYRLNIFGFLSMEDSVMPGNMGLKDQQLALKWVKENIDVFGGDSTNITIFGESAGGASVHYQILSKGSKGLFNRAILQSGNALCPWASNKNHRKFAIETGQSFNCSVDLGTEKYLECIQNVHPYYLLIAAAKTEILGLQPDFVRPRVDGEFIDKAPELLMNNGEYSKVDIIAGVNRDEGGMVLAEDYQDPNRRASINNDFEKLGPISLLFENEKNPLELTNQVYRHYLNRDNVTYTNSDWREIMDMNSDRLFKVSHDIVMHIFAEDPDVKVYLYELDHFGQVSGTNDIQGYDRRNLITHADDLVYFFYDGKSLAYKMKDEGDLKVRQNFIDLWTNFAITGNPTPSGYDFIWEEAKPESFRHLSVIPSPVMKDDTFQEKRKFWSSLNTTENSILRNVF